ncbi:hypothetical protein CPB97_008420 [Podila verticillata]|nr:hypothetical protein CPB97_008420 [Podila verticillata]
MSGNNNNSDRFAHHRPPLLPHQQMQQQQQQFRPPHHIPGQVPPFIHPRPIGAPLPTHGRPVAQFPGQPQFPGQAAFNRPIPGQQPFVHQPHQFHQQNVHQPLPTGAAFHAMVHAQNMSQHMPQNVYPIRTNSGSSPVSSASIASPTSPSPPSRQLPPIPTEDSARSGVHNLSAGFKEVRQRMAELQAEDTESDVQKAINKGVDVAMAVTATATTGSVLVNQGLAIAHKALDGKGQEIINKIESNPVLGHLVQLADKLVDIGKTVPFIAPAFVILKFIIDVETKARDADNKCSDLLERINFMVSNITVLEKVKAIDPLVAVIESMNETLKQAASLIQAYRKQGAIARRLNMSNSQNFTSMAARITACSHDLMLSLQIQQTGDISILTRAVPIDPQDEEAKRFVQEHGGQNIINSRPDLVEEFAKKMHLTMSEQVMDQMQSSMEDLLEENQSKIEALLKENSSNTVAETIRAMAEEAREREAEQKLTCLQCNLSYRASANGPEACNFHKAMELSGGFSCCGNRAPCTYGSHRSSHHCDYPYTTFYEYACGIIGYTDTIEEWASVNDTDLLTNTTQKASVGKLLRWRSRHEQVSKPLMVIHVGRITFETPYFFHVFDAEALKTANEAVRWTGKTTIFRTRDGDDEYAMAEWTLDGAGVINGVMVSAKAATSDVVTTTLAPLNIDSVSLNGEATPLSKGSFKVYKPAEAYRFPETKRVGHVLRETPLRATREFKARTNLPIVVMPQGKMVANTNGKFMRFNADKFQGTLRIFNKASPASQTYVTLGAATAEYRFVGEEEYQEVESLTLGDVKFPVSIGPTESLDVPFEAIVRRSEEQAALMQNCWGWAMRALHRPVRIRLTFKDIEDEECVLVQEYIHQPSPRMAKREEDDLCFLFLDDSLDGTRSTVRVKKSNDAECVISLNSNRLTVEDLNKIVFKAEKSGESEVKLGYGSDSGTYKWDVWALIDKACRRVYGFKVLMTEGSTRTKNTSAALGYAACPIYGESDTMEERPIQYADEKIGFPELTPEDPIVVIEDDQVDDVKPPTTPIPDAQVAAAVVAEPVVAIAATASSSVSAAIAEVSKATSSLDTAVFTGSMASLERRLESLDVNVARMATALEKLVDILSH